MKNFLFVIFCALLSIPFIPAKAQNIKYVHKVVKELGMPNMYGRSAFRNGDSIAADYVAKEFRRLKLKFFGTDYYQHFSTPVITLEDVSLSFGNNSEIMKPDENYFVLGFSPSCDIEIKNEKPIFIDGKAHWELIKKTKLDNIILVFNQKTMPITLKQMSEFVDNDFTAINPKLVIFQGYDKLSFYIGREQIKKFPIVQFVGEPITQTIEYMKLHIKNSLLPEHHNQNVIGYIEGKQKDKFVLLTAHYDGLGMFGDKVFPCAHDNASGIATILDLAGYFSQPANKPQYSLVIVAFGAEEIGMLGSNYYVNNPLFPLEKINFVINLDIVGTGSAGLAIVNGDKQSKVFSELEKINNEEKYFFKLKADANRCNSDHCAFDNKGIPAIFAMTMGGEFTWSHSIFDSYENLPFTKYDALFRLFRDFLQSYKF